MGIKNFYRILPSVFPSSGLAFGDRRPRTYAHALFDFNNLLYSGGSETQAQFVRHCVRQASKWLTHAVVATDSIYFAVDGAAPAAKLWLQRARRADESDSLRKDLLFYGPRPTSPSSIELTPATPLMASVYDALSYSACSHLSRPATRASAPRLVVHVDGSSTPGEGEFKLFRHLAHLPPDDAALVISGDSDVVLMGLLSRRRRLDVLTSNAAASGGFSVDELRAAIAQRFAHSSAADLERVVDDVVLFILLLGSDFTPSLLHYSLPDTLSMYARLRRTGRFVYDRAADSIDVAALLKCVVSRAERAADDGLAAAAPFVERFGPLVHQAVSQRSNVASFLQGLQWSMSYLAGTCLNDRYFCKQLRGVTVNELAAWAASTNTAHTPPVPRRAAHPLFPASALVAVCPLRFTELVAEPLRGLHSQVWHEMELASAQTLADASVDTAPVARVLDSLNRRVAAAADKSPSTFLTSIAKHAPVGIYERDDSGKHLFVWPRLPRILPERRERTGIVHRLKRPVL